MIHLFLRKLLHTILHTILRTLSRGTFYIPNILAREQFFSQGYIVTSPAFSSRRNLHSNLCIVRGLNRRLLLLLRLLAPALPGCLATNEAAGDGNVEQENGDGSGSPCDKQPAKEDARDRKPGGGHHGYDPAQESGYKKGMDEVDAKG